MNAATAAETHAARDRTFICSPPLTGSNTHATCDAQHGSPRRHTLVVRHIRATSGRAYSGDPFAPAGFGCPQTGSTSFSDVPGGTVDSRTTSSQCTAMCTGGRFGCAIRSFITLTARWAIAPAGWRTVVSGTVSSDDVGVSSKPASLI